VGIGIACMVVVVVLWSMVPILVKQLLAVFDPFTIAFLRAAQGAGFALALLYAGGRSVRSIVWSRWHAVGGMGIGLNYALYALSLSYTTASVGVLIVQVQYVALALLAVVVLGERIGLGKLAGMGLVLAGIAAVIVWGGDVGELIAPDYMRGNAIMLLSGLGWGIYALSNKVLAPRAPSGAILAPMMGLGALLIGVLAAASFQLRAAPDAGDLLSLVALGVVGTGLSFTLVSEGMKRLSATLAGSITTATPIAQITLANQVLGEPLGWHIAGGGALIITGILAMALAERYAQRVR
jgi:drug/metabolite transporter (DMT)-like permease